ncbi:MAG: STAS/SEC14 domain-containing protein [Synoicihabitans sp.]
MIDICPESHHDTVIARATGILTAADYETRFQPYIEEIIEKYGKVNVVLHLDEQFEGWDLGAMWDDASFSLKHRHDFNRLAVVGAQAWFKWAMNLGSKFLDGQFMTFASNDLAGAIAWVNAGPVGGDGSD